MNDREIDRLKRNPKAFRDLALLLLRIPDAAWTEWELDFLENVSMRAFDDGPSTRQCEVLLDSVMASRPILRLRDLASAR